MFDLGEIVEKRQASFTTDPQRIEEGEEGFGAHDGSQHRYRNLSMSFATSVVVYFYGSSLARREVLVSETDGLLGFVIVNSC